ncbi:MAG: hypothetical protein RBS57_02430 [Desulforhabdus sp.]|jgi:hypothetical protein|nr:hypothetical protein [Desulforhabdus sp.]HNR66627.1 hypothetical protein [bacterium]HOX84812.1 hypothetical protein [bacterium]HPG44323.1 hypothetical protein [bacterium]HPM96690.1 hypothetical protein [bacterium]
MRRFFIAFMLLFTLCFSVDAEEDASQHHVSLTISPFHLFNPELHVTGEVRLTPKMSVAIMLGAGRITDEGKTCSIWEGGGQFRYYLLGDFEHGTMIGADVGYVDIDAQIEDPIAYLVGVHAGGFLGYKFSMQAGFTAELQIGPVFLWGETADTSEWQTLQAFKIGWSF